MDTLIFVLLVAILLILVNAFLFRIGGLVDWMDGHGWAGTKPVLYLLLGMVPLRIRISDPADVVVYFEGVTARAPSRGEFIRIKGNLFIVTAVVSDYTSMVVRVLVRSMGEHACQSEKTTKTDSPA